MRLSLKPISRPLLWLVAAAVCSVMSSWGLYFYDASFIGPDNDRAGMIYVAMIPWWVGALVVSSMAYRAIWKYLGPSTATEDLWILLGGAVLTFIAWGPLTAVPFVMLLGHRAG